MVASISPSGIWPWPSGCAASWRRLNEALLVDYLPVAGGRRATAYGSEVMRDHLGQVQRAQGRLDAAHRTYREALAIHRAPPRQAQPCPVRALAHVGLAEVAYERNEFDAAMEHVTQGITLCRQFVYTPPLAAGLATLAWIRQAAGDRAGHVTRWRRRSRAPPARAVAQPCPGAAGTATAGPGGPGRGGAMGGTAGSARVTSRTTRRSRVSGPGAVTARPGHAPRPVRCSIGCTRPPPPSSRTGAPSRSALLALALAAMGDEEGAWAALASALNLGWPQGYIRVFADEGPFMAALLGRLIAAQRSEQLAARIPLSYLARVQRSFGGGQPSGPAGRCAAADSRSRAGRAADRPGT